MSTRNHVVVVDLRNVDPTRAIDIDAIQRAAIEGLQGAVKTHRVLMLDTTTYIAARRDQIQELLGAPSVGYVLVLLSGSEEGDGVICSLPDSLARRGDRSGVIWVGDPRGVEWDSVNRHDSATVTDPSDPNGDGNWTALFDALRLPEVFDRCVDAFKSMDPPVASPGLRLIRAGGRGLEPGLQTLALKAVQDVAGDDRGGLPTVPQHEELDRLLGKAVAPLEPFVEGVGLGAAVQACESARVRASEALIRTRIGAFTTRGANRALRAVREVADHGDEVDRSWRSTIGRIEPSTGTDTESLARLAPAKLALRTAPGEWLKAANVRLRQAVSDALGNSHALDRAAYVAAQIAQRARPNDQLTITVRIDQIGLAGTARRLRDAELPAERLDPKTILAYVLVVALAASLAPNVFTVVAAPIICVGVLTISRGCYAAWYPDTPWRLLGVVTLTALYAMLCTVAAAAALVSPVPDSVLSIPAAAAAALLFAWMAVTAQRRRQFDEWRAAIPLEQIGVELERFKRDVPAIVLNEILLANSRVELATNPSPSSPSYGTWPRSAGRRSRPTRRTTRAPHRCSTESSSTSAA